MKKLFKSDLTYSLSGGFLAGALVLFFMQPVDQQKEVSKSLSSTVEAAGQLIG